MSNERFTENNYEQALIDLFMDMGYEYDYGPNMGRDYREPVNKGELHNELAWFNCWEDYANQLPDDVFDKVIGEAVRKITSINEGTLEQRNEQFMDYLQNGVPVSFQYEGKTRTEIVKLIDFKNPSHCRVKVVNQYSVEEFGKIRCDMVVFCVDEDFFHVFDFK